MGYDGIYLSRVVKPSAGDLPAEHQILGRLAADKLIELIEHPRVTLPEQIRFPANCWTAAPSASFNKGPKAPGAEFLKNEFFWMENHEGGLLL